MKMVKQKKNEFKKDKKKFPLRCMGISNIAINTKSVKMPSDFYAKKYSVQFYDFDLPKHQNTILENQIKTILEIFPYDCICYKTKHGFHFISFALLRGLRVTKARAIKLSKDLLDQDYFTKRQYLTLRISEKWKNKKFRKKYAVISDRPKFFGLLKEPAAENLMISEKHLEFYKDNLALPDFVYEKYEKCRKFDLGIELHHFTTRD